MLLKLRILVVKIIMYILHIIIYITLKKRGESLPIVVMVTTTFIHYMVVIYITSSEWHCHFTQLVKSTNVQGRARQQMSLENNS